MVSAAQGAGELTGMYVGWIGLPIAFGIAVGAGTEELLSLSQDFAMAHANQSYAEFMQSKLIQKSVPMLSGGAAFFYMLSSKIGSDWNKRISDYLGNKTRDALGCPDVEINKTAYKLGGVAIALPLLTYAGYVSYELSNAANQPETPAVSTPKKAQNDNPGKLTYENGMAVLTLAAPAQKI